MSVSRDAFYPLSDWPPPSWIEYPPDATTTDRLIARSRARNNMRAQWTGEYRPPKAGEWYLSGSIIEAYQARHDLASSYCIARIARVEVKTVVTTTITEQLTP